VGDKIRERERGNVARQRKKLSSALEKRRRRRELRKTTLQRIVENDRKGGIPGVGKEKVSKKKRTDEGGTHLEESEGRLVSAGEGLQANKSGGRCVVKTAVFRGGKRVKKE